VSSADDDDWTRHSGSTISSNTGPAGGAGGSNYCMYVETSYGSAYTAGDAAIFQSPIINGTNIHLAIQYHMYGYDIGTWSVDVFSGGA
jgi:hypothetical protein